MKIIFILVCFISYASFAGEVSLVKITNEEDREVSEMFIEVNENGDISQFGKNIYLNGKKIKTDLYGDSLNYDGIVLERQRGRDVVILRGLNIDTLHGGGLEVDYLYNGITGSRSSFELELSRKDSRWSVQRNDKTIFSLHCVSHKKPFVGTIGIKKIIAK